jgi:hypothetical protein
MEINPLHIDRWGHTKATIDVGGHGATAPWRTSVNGTPAQVAEYLRELADAIERLEGWMG